MDKKATLTLNDGRSLELPVLSGTVGPDVVDIRALYGKAGVFTYDPGFMSTASCNSTITYIDGDAGVLLYRGYPIEQLAVRCDFLEVCYLLLNGELPNAAQQKDFVATVTRHTMVHDQLNRFFTGFRRDAHPMATMVGVVGALSAFYHDSLDINDAELVLLNELLDHADHDLWEIVSGRSEHYDPRHAALVARLRTS